MIAALVRCAVAAVLTFAAYATTAQTIYRRGQTYSRVPRNVPRRAAWPQATSASLTK